MTAPNFPNSLWQQAASFAAAAHRHQFRKDGLTPYFAHPVRVCLTVRHIFGCEDEATLAAALLHDTIEDTSTDYDDIASRFGVEVADLVAAVTKSMILPEEEREREYDARLARADWRARLIKLADVHDNLADAIACRPEAIAKAKDKARRAIALAEQGGGAGEEGGDAKSHAETRSAIAAVRALMSRG